MTILNQEMVSDLQEMLGDEFGFFLDTFTRDMNTRCKAIAVAVTAQDVDAVRHASHSLKGSSSNLGADCLMEICSKLEALSVAGSLAGADQLVFEIERARQDLIIVLEKMA